MDNVQACRPVGPGRRRGRAPLRRGFTLVELMVTVTIILVLVLVTVPSIRGLLLSSQLAQADNLVRSMLMSARLYALRNDTVAGVRFQSDGNMVLVWGEQVSARDYTTLKRYRMRAVEGIAPAPLPGPYRVTPMDVSLGKAPPEWWDEWFMFPVVLFASNGRVILSECEFAEDWYPTTAGAFGELRTPAVFAYQANYSYTPTGPALSAALKIFNYAEFQTVSDKATAIGKIGSDCLLDIHTGMIVRQRDWQDVEKNN